MAAVALSPTDHGAAAIALPPWLIVACVVFLRQERLVAAPDAS
jgi:hypothetical protein